MQTITASHIAFATADGAELEVYECPDGMFAFRIERDLASRCEYWPTVEQAMGRMTRWVEARGGVVVDLTEIAA